MFRNVVLPKNNEVNAIEQNAERGVAGSGTFKTIEVGAGDKTFKMDERGIWMGSSDFNEASFKVDMQGNILITATEETPDTGIKYYKNNNLVILIGMEEV